MNFAMIKTWLAGLCVVALVGCGGGGTSGAGTPLLGGGSGGSSGGSGGTVTALFTTAPNALTLGAAVSTESFVITGGVAPYTVTTSNPAVAAVVFAGTSFKISGVADGEASVAVKDAAGASVVLKITVTAPLLTTAPMTLALRPAEVSATYAVSGGKLPYTAATSNAAVATVALTGSSFKVTGVANGSASISVKDAAGAEVLLPVTVAAPLFTTAPSTLTLRAADTTEAYTINGGKAPYVVVSSNMAVATAALTTASTFRIVGVTNGATTVYVIDDTGAQLTVAVAVFAPLFSTAPATLILPTGSSSEPYTLSGGRAPYSVISASPAVVSVSAVVNNKFTITALKDGLAEVYVSDADGTRLVTSVVASTSSVALFTTAPTAITLRASGRSDSYTIGGGKSPYTTVTSNAAVVTVLSSGANNSSFVLTGGSDGIAAVTVTDSAGKQVSVGVTVSTNSAALFSTAPSTLTLRVGAGSDLYAISGGKAPYSVVTSNAALVAVAQTDSTFRITGVANGTAAVSVKDSAGAEVLITTTVSSSAGVLFTTAPPILTVGVGQTTDEYIVSGGQSPYSIASSNVAVANVGINGSRFVITGVAGGQIKVVLKDSLGATLTLDVSVGAAAALFTTAPSLLNQAITVVRSFVIAGGAAPYTASTSDSAIATVTVTGTALAITAVKPGTANIVVKDAINGQVQIQVTVPSSPTPVPAALFTTAPTAVSVKVAPGTRPTFTIGGGTAPYAVQTNNLAVTSASILNGTTLEIFGVATGSAVVAVTDAVGGRVEISVDVGGANVVALYTTAPAGLTVVSGSSRNVEIGGGVGAYLVNSADTSKVTVTISGSTATVTAVSAGTALISVFDALGTSVNFPVTVPATAALFSTAPAVLSAAPGNSLDFVVGGGTGPYTATSSNAGVVVSSVPGGSPNTLRLLAGVAGSAQVVVRDSVGATLPVQVVVTAVALGTSAPDNIKLVSSAAATVYGVTGGTAPYSIASSDSSVVTVTPVTLAGGLYSFSATGVRPGAAALVLRDANNASVTVNATVATAAILAVAAPATVTLQPGGTVANYTISGGLAPYFAVSADAAIASVVVGGVGGATLTVTPVATGSTTVVVRDSLGSTVNLTVIVGPVTALFTSATPAVTIARGSVGSYTVGGGAGSYTAISSDQAVATATLTGFTLTITGVSQGNASVQVRDAAGGLVTIGVTVGPGLALFTSAPATITVLPLNTYSYLIGGGTSPYRIDSSNTAIATAVATLTGLDIRGVVAGSTVVQVTDAVGAKLSIAVTVTPASVSPLTVTPEAVTASVGDQLNFVISGGDPFAAPAAPYTVTVQNTSLMTASSASTVGGLTSFNAALLNAGATSVIVTDSKGQTKVITLTITDAQPLLRLSPSMIEISEKFGGIINFYVSGGEGLLTAYTNRLDLSSVPAAPFGIAVLPATSVAVPVGLGTAGNRCVAVLDAAIPTDYVDVTITVVDDKTGRSATSILRIKDNRSTCP